MQAHARLLVESAGLLVSALSAEPELRRALTIRISHQEREADELIEAIRQAPVMVKEGHPRGSELQRTADACERVFDRLEDTASWIVNASAGDIPLEFISACSTIHRCAELIFQSISHFNDADELQQLSDQIRAARKTAAVDTREAYGRLLTNEADNAIEIVRLREFHSFLERTLNEIKSVADTLSELGRAV